MRAKLFTVVLMATLNKIKEEKKKGWKDHFEGTPYKPVEKEDCTTDDTCCTGFFILRSGQC